MAVSTRELSRIGQRSPRSVSSVSDDFEMPPSFARELCLIQSMDTPQGSVSGSTVIAGGAPEKKLLRQSIPIVSEAAYVVFV